MRVIAPASAITKRLSYSNILSPNVSRSASPELFSGGRWGCAKTSMVRVLTHRLKMCILAMLLFLTATSTNAQGGLYDIVPLNATQAFNYQQAPHMLVAAHLQGNVGTFQWQYCETADGVFQDISGTNTPNYTPPATPLTASRWYRRITTNPAGIHYSNTVKYELVSKDWEDLNYVREHSLLVPNQTDWQTIDQLPIGQGGRLVKTSYFDGLGRTIQTNAKAMATPATTGGQWGDVVSHVTYDILGRSPLSYLPYTSTTLPGKYKATAPADQSTYYQNLYNDNKPFAQKTYEASPLYRQTEVKAPGAAWNTANGEKINLTTNTVAQDIKIFNIGPLETDMPVLKTAIPLDAVYAENTLMVTTSTDVNGYKTHQFYNDNGLLVQKRVQKSNAVNQYSAYLITIYVYDEFGRLRCEIPPEGVEWLNSNGWNMSTGLGPNVFYELCFVYAYDDKGRTIYKKSPGAEPLHMLYDTRDRLIMMQDGNQRLKSPAEWTVNLYDDLDRPITTLLYRTSTTRATLQGQLNSQPATTPIVSLTDQANTAISTILKRVYYDDYSFPNAKPFNQAAATAATQTITNALPIATTQRQTGLPTGSHTRVLGSTTFLVTTQYYNEEGSPIQSLADNIKQGEDIATSQYHWDGRSLATHSIHGLPGSPYHQFATLTTYQFDQVGRPTQTLKKWGSNAARVTASYQYDDLGRLKNKTLDPAYTHPVAGIGPVGGGLETLAYSYNIQGTLTGINQDYALKNAGYDKWQHFFGFYLGYEANPGGVFTNAARLNGQMRGQVWTTQGDDAQRRYQYTYDFLGQLTEAAFTDKPATGGSFSNTSLDFSTKINNFRTNGNFYDMTNRGFQFGNASPVNVDNLAYVYTNSGRSNRLSKVTDNPTATDINGKQGDFKDGANGAAADYAYDANGNMVIDHNKNIKNLSGANGIIYNHLDKPEEIKIDGPIDNPNNGTIKITYDANGSRLKRQFTSTAGVVKTTWYINEFVYEETTTVPPSGGGGGLQLQFIGFAEGRIRPVTPVATDNGLDAHTLAGNLTLPGGKQGSLDYFISDHRTDTRMVLTEETQWSRATASMETANGRGTIEEALFGQTGTNNEVFKTRVPKSEAPGWTSNASAYISKLNSTQKVGPNQLLKVMAGDLLSTYTEYYYNQNATNNSGSTVFSSVTEMLENVLLNSMAPPAAAKNPITAAAITDAFNTGTPFSHLISPDITNSGGIIPKAYLNIVFFDERFRFVEESSTSLRVGGQGAGTLTLPYVKAPKNGYCFAYISNESSINVFFDNFKVRHDRGRIIEENHYYPYGLKIAPLSSKAYGAPNNNYTYQGDYSEVDDDLGWHVFALRSYDPQTGRFLQNDPYEQFSSGYIGMGNDPVNLVDEDGGCAGCKVASSFAQGSSASGLQNIVFTVSRATSATANVGANLLKTTLSAVNTTVNIGRAVGDATSVANNSPKSMDELLQRQPIKEPEPATSIFNPPNDYTKNNNPSLGLLQWIGNTLWEGSGAKDVELYIKDRASGYIEGDVFQDAQVIFQAGTILSGPKGKPAARIKGNKIRNGHLGGNVHPKTGVPFDKSGFPDFSNNLYKDGINDVMIKPTGNRDLDFAAANKAANYDSQPKGYSWHHHQTTGRMQLVDQDIHRLTGHTGGFSLWKF